MVVRFVLNRILIALGPEHIVKYFEGFGVDWSGFTTCSCSWLSLLALTGILVTLVIFRMVGETTSAFVCQLGHDMLLSTNKNTSLTKTYVLLSATIHQPFQCVKSRMENVSLCVPGCVPGCSGQVYEWQDMGSPLMGRRSPGGEPYTDLPLLGVFLTKNDAMVLRNLLARGLDDVLNSFIELIEQCVGAGTKLEFHLLLIKRNHGEKRYLLLFINDKGVEKCFRSSYRGEHDGTAKLRVIGIGLHRVSVRYSNT